MARVAVLARRGRRQRWSSLQGLEVVSFLAELGGSFFPMPKEKEKQTRCDERKTVLSNENDRGKCGLHHVGTLERENGE